MDLSRALFREQCREAIILALQIGVNGTFNSQQLVAHGQCLYDNRTLTVGCEVLCGVDLGRGHPGSPEFIVLKCVCCLCIHLFC